jgi:hypothetical protein
MEEDRKRENRKNKTFLTFNYEIKKNANKIKGFKKKRQKKERREVKYENIKDFFKVKAILKT